MERRITFIVSSLTMALLFVAALFVVGCDQGRLPVTPDEEYLLAPGTGNPQGNANGNDKPKADCVAECIAECNANCIDCNVNCNANCNVNCNTNGNATGNPHVGNNPNANPNAGGNGNNKGNGNSNFKPKTNNGRGRPLVSGFARRMGAVKELLWHEEDLPLDEESSPVPVGWVIANTTANGDEVVPLEATGNTLIVTVHLNAGEPNEEFDIDVVVNGGIIHGAGTITTNHKGKGTTQIKIPLDVTDGDGSVFVQVILEGQEDYATIEFKVALKKQGP